MSKLNMVLGFAFTMALKKVLLIEKIRPEWQAGKLNGIGGKIDPGESAYMAMVREFKEETGLHFPDWHYVGEMLQPNQWRVSVFTTRTEMVMEAMQIEEEKPILVEVADLPSNVIHNLRWIIPFCLDLDAVIFDVRYGK